MLEVAKNVTLVPSNAPSSYYVSQVYKIDFYRETLLPSHMYSEDESKR